MFINSFCRFPPELGFKNMRVTELKGLDKMNPQTAEFLSVLNDGEFTDQQILPTLRQGKFWRTEIVFVFYIVFTLTVPSRRYPAS